MSYDVYLENAGPVESFEEGGTYALGGTDQPELNVTYNYSEVYRLLDFGLRDLDGKRADDTLPTLQRIVDKLGTKTYPDYWAPTPGNAGKALARLLSWAKQYPDGIWRVS